MRIARFTTATIIVQVSPLSLTTIRGRFDRGVASTRSARGARTYAVSHLIACGDVKKSSRHLGVSRL